MIWTMVGLDVGPFVAESIWDATEALEEALERFIDDINYFAYWEAT
jgi:hypothetical protein